MSRTRLAAILIAAAIYVLMPADLVADFWPLVGWVDDLLVALLAVYLVFRGFSRRVTVEGEAAGAAADAAEAEDPYRVLGLEPGADRQQVHEAYRRQMAQYHPDKVAHLGPELRRLATLKTLAIQRAYQRLSG